MLQPSFLTTDKSWDDVFPAGGAGVLIDTLHRESPCRIIFFGETHLHILAAASLAGVQLKQPVQRVNLSTVVSANAAKTQKNIDNAFHTAAGQNWVLFFDEADALFGKRTDVKDSHDKYASSTADYLLQQIAGSKQPVFVGIHSRASIPSYILRHFHLAVNLPQPRRDGNMS